MLINYRNFERKLNRTRVEIDGCTISKHMEESSDSSFVDNVYFEVSVSKIAIETTVRIEELFSSIVKFGPRYGGVTSQFVKFNNAGKMEKPWYSRTRKSLPSSHDFQGSASTSAVAERRDHPVFLNVHRGDPTLWPMEGMGLRLRRTLRRVG